MGAPRGFMKQRPKWGAVLCAPNDSHVVEKRVCFNEKNARLQCVQWAKQFPDHLTRHFSLGPQE